MRLRGVSVLALMVVMAVACVAAPGGTAGMQATDVWVRAAASGNSAAYMVLHNGGSAADRLVKVESDVASAVEIHQTTMDGSVMKMSPVEGVEIPARGQVALKPGGFHVMLIGLNRELKAGDKVTLTLQFEKAGTQTVEAEVRNS